MAVQNAGAQVTKEIVTSVAAKNGCPFVLSNKLKPIDFDMTRL
jgi:hypothetical protein